MSSSSRLLTKSNSGDTLAPLNTSLIFDKVQTADQPESSAVELNEPIGPTESALPPHSILVLTPQVLPTSAGASAEVRLNSTEISHIAEISSARLELQNQMESHQASPQRPLPAGTESSRSATPNQGSAGPPPESELIVIDTCQISEFRQCTPSRSAIQLA